MNIDYAKIIELANKRRSVLQNLEALLSEAGAQAQKVVEARAWVDEIAVVFRELDAEGEKLLPVGIQTALAYINTTGTRLSDALDSNPTRNSGIHNHGMVYLNG